MTVFFRITSILQEIFRLPKKYGNKYNFPIFHFAVDDKTKFRLKKIAHKRFNQISILEVIHFVGAKIKSYFIRVLIPYTHIHLVKSLRGEI